MVLYKCLCIDKMLHYVLSYYKLSNNLINVKYTVTLVYLDIFNKIENIFVFISIFQLMNTSVIYCDYKFIYICRFVFSSFADIIKRVRKIR